MPALGRSCSPAQKRLDDFRQQGRVQAGSLIISVFGDAVLPRGSRIWLGSLIRLLEPLELNERLMRTSVFRLAKEEWLRTEPSAGAPTTCSRPPASAASRKPRGTSTPPAPPVGPALAPHRHRRRARPQGARGPAPALFWQGFGTLGGDCFVHPSADLSAAFDALLAEGLADLLGKLKPLLAADAQFGNAANDVDMVNGAWNLERLAGVYAGFVERYQPVLDSCAPTPGDIDDERLPAAHPADPRLPPPAAARPGAPRRAAAPDWPGQKARLLCKELYRRLLSERHLDAHFQLASGQTPPALERFREDDPLAALALHAQSTSGIACPCPHGQRRV
jgi:phenylacetic acid degradation operon negative regulatory protein